MCAQCLRSLADVGITFENAFIRLDSRQMLPQGRKESLIWLVYSVVIDAELTVSAL